MQRHVTRLADLLLGHARTSEKLSPLSSACVQCSTTLWRFFAHGNSGPSASPGQRRVQAARKAPLLTTDEFGRPTLIHPSSAPDAWDGGQRSVTPYDVADDPPHARSSGQASKKIDGKGELKRRSSILHRTRAKGDVEADEAGLENTGPIDSPVGLLRDELRNQRRPPPKQASDPYHDFVTPHTAPAATRTASKRQTTAETAGGAALQAAPPRPGRRRGGGGAAAAQLPLGPTSRDRMLTFRLLKASSLQELDQLLSVHPDRPNMIHLAAAARQAVLLGSLPQPRETRQLLDRHLERLAEGAAATARAAAANAAGPWSGATAAAPSSSAAAAGGGGGGGGRGLKSRQQRSEDEVSERGMVGIGPAAASFAPHQGIVQGAAASGGDASADVKEPHSHTLDAGAAVAAPPPPPPPPLREVGDVLWAYGKLLCKPPERVWSAVLRPVVLDPSAWQHLRESAATAAATAAADVDADRSKRHRRPIASGASSGEDDPLGRELSKHAVALARMREVDQDVWRVLARAAAAAAPDMSPRALSSTLWAFGSVRMTHGSLLAASTRSVHAKLRQFNSQDLVCVMWALSRLAGPPPQAPSPKDGSGAAVSRAAIAAAAAQHLLYGDLSDAVRRCLQLRGFKPSELTTLLGVLDEMAEHQQERQQLLLFPLHRRGHGHGGGGGQALHVSPRLLRVVSQAVRKNLASLPVGALAVASSAFQRLGHHDAALFRALAYAMALRLRHMEPRHMLRAAAAMQAAGHTDRAFFTKLLEAAQSRLAAFKRHELLALAEVCSRLAGTAAAATATADTAAARAFLHAAVLHAVASVEPSLRGSGRRHGGAAAAQASSSSQHSPLAESLTDSSSLEPGGGEPSAVGDSDGAGQAAGPTAAVAAPAMAHKHLRLRHWHRLLRAAAAAGWRDDGLAGRALDGMVQELRRVRPGWLTTVKARASELASVMMTAAATAAEAAEVATGMPEGTTVPAAVDEGSEGRWARGLRKETELGDEADQTWMDAGSMHDTAAGEVAGIVWTAALVGQRQRVDVVAAVVSSLLRALRIADDAMPPAPPSPLGGLLRRPPPLARDAVALSPEALAELQRGLESFGAALATLENRRTRIAVQVVRQRLGLWAELARTHEEDAEAAGGVGRREATRGPG